MNVMLDFICMGPVDLQGAYRKRHNTKWKIQVHSVTRTYNLKICILMLYRLSYPGYDESCPIKVNFINKCTFDTNVYICISSRMMKLSVFCLVRVLYFFYMLNISILDKQQKDTQIPCLLSTYKTRPNTQSYLWYFEWNEFFFFPV